MSNIHVIYMHLICVKCELQNGSMSFLHFPFFSNFYQLHMLLDSLICKDAHTIFWASFVINIFPQLHIFTEIIYVVPHVKYCTCPPGVMLAGTGKDRSYLILCLCFYFQESHILMQRKSIWNNESICCHNHNTRAAGVCFCNFHTMTNINLFQRYAFL